MERKSLIVGILVGIAIGAVSSFLVFELPSLLLSNTLSNTTRLIVSDSWNTIYVQGSKFQFSFVPSSKWVGASYGVSPAEGGGFNATAGKSLEWHGVEITVSEVHSDYVVLLIKPL